MSHNGIWSPSPVKTNKLVYREPYRSQFKPNFACIFYNFLENHKYCFRIIRLVSVWHQMRGTGNNKNYLCCTLRSWVHDIFSHYRTVSPRLGDNCASKCCSDNFPHTKYMSPCVENSQNHTLMIRCSPIAGRRFEKLGKLWDRFVP